MKNVNYLKIKEIFSKYFRKFTLYLAFLLTGAALTAFYIQSKPAERDLTVYKTGEVSVSINEKGELAFLGRKTGETVIVDSTLTEIINNMLASREYVKVNTMRN